MRIKLGVPFLLFCVLASMADADSSTPCTSGTVAQIYNTTCTINNLVFSFAPPFAVDSNVDPTKITFTPIADGFRLGGLNENTPILFPGTGEIFLFLPVVQISTLNGQPTIDDLTTSNRGRKLHPRRIRIFLF